MDKVLEEIHKIGIIPVVVLEDAKKARPLGHALCDGGLPCAEVTFRTSAAEEAIRILSEECPQMLIGAGTVLTTEQVDRAVGAGARFIVSPGLNPRIVKYCVEKGILIIPGCATPSDIEQALENGLEAVKFFPAEPAGGLKMVRALAGPYVNMRFIPTGGIDAKNIQSYLTYGRVLACGGSWMVKKELIGAGDFRKIEKLAKEAVEIVQASRA